VQLSVRKPSLLAVDGNLTEWGSLASKGQPQDLSVSYLAIAVNDDRFALAASLRPQLNDGVWFGIATESAKLPAPYEHVIMGQETKDVRQGDPQPALSLPLSAEGASTSEASRARRAEGRSMVLVHKPA